MSKRSADEGNWRILLALLLVGGGFMVPTGYQMTNVNIAQPKFMAWLSRALKTDVSDVWTISLWSTIVSARLIGNVFGASISSVLADTFGRRKALLFLTFPMILGDALAYTTKFSNCFWQLIVGRLLTGFADGAIWNCLVVFFTEVSPAVLRGRIGASLMILREFGMLLGIVIGFPRFLGSSEHIFEIFLISLAMECTIPAILIFFPESPRYLYVHKRNYAETGRSLRFYHGKDASLEEILKEFEKAELLSREAPSFRAQISRREFKLALFLSVCFGSSFGFAGRFVLLNYSSGLLQQAGFSIEQAHLGALVIQFLPIPVGLIDIPLVDRFGRRPILVGACICTMILELGIFVLFRVRADLGIESDAIKWGIGILIGAWEPIMIGGLMCLHFVPSELFSQNTRALGFSIHTLCWFLMGALTTQVFDVLQHMGEGYGVLFLLIPFFMIATLLMLFLPETKNRSVEAIAADMHTLKVHYPIDLSAILERRAARRNTMPVYEVDVSPTTLEDPSSLTMFGNDDDPLTNELRHRLRANTDLSQVQNGNLRPRSSTFT